MPTGRGNLDAIVALYLRDYQPRLAAQLQTFSDEPSLNAAVHHRPFVDLLGLEVVDDVFHP
jgi:hypothetical protein